MTDTFEPIKFDLDVMASHLLEAACFADSDEEQCLSPSATEASFAVARRYCEEFVALADADLQKLQAYPAYWAHPDCQGHVEAAIGHDLWLTAGGHGVGFWCRDSIPDELGEVLSTHAKALERMHDGLYQDGDSLDLQWLEPRRYTQGSSAAENFA